MDWEEGGDKARQTQGEEARPKEDRPSPRDKDVARNRRSRFTPTGGQVQSRRGATSLDGRNRADLRRQAGNQGRKTAMEKP